MHGTLAVIEKQETAPEPIAAQIEKNPSLVLISDQSRNDFFADLKKKVSALSPDMESKKNREARRSMSATICRSKKPIDDARKALKAKVDATAKTCIGDLESLQAEARAPLDEWENEEKKWKEYQVVAHGWTSDFVLGRLEWAKDEPCRESLKVEKEAAISILAAAYQRLLQEEEDAAELARLREKEAAEARRKTEESRLAAELAAALDDKARSRPPATDFAGVRKGVQEAQVSAPIISRADAAFIAKLTEIREDIMRAAADGGFAISVQAARAIVRAIVAGKVHHIPALQL